MVIKVVHDPVKLRHELLVLLIVTAAEILVHHAELQLPQRAERRLEIQTLRVRRHRCDAQRQSAQDAGCGEPHRQRGSAGTPRHDGGLWTAQIPAAEFGSPSGLRSERCQTRRRADV